MYRDDPAEASRCDCLASTLDKRIVPAMMPDKEWHAGVLARIDQSDSTFQIVSDRLLDESRDAGGDACQAVLDVHLVRSRDNNTVGLLSREHCMQVRVPCGFCLPGNVARIFRWIDNRNQLRILRCENPLDMALSDHSSTDDDQTDGLRRPIHVMPLLLVERGLPAAYSTTEMYYSAAPSPRDWIACNASMMSQNFAEE